MFITIILLYKIELPKIQLYPNGQLNLNLMRQFLNKIPNLIAEKPSQFFVQ